MNLSMADGYLSPAMAAAELMRRRRSRESLVAFSQAITIPGAPISDDPGEWLFKPIELSVASHHALTMEVIQRTIEKHGGRCMIFEPPGSAKSTYAAVVAPAWAMGRKSGTKVIVTSYAARPAERASKRARAIVGSSEYQNLWEQPVGLQPGSTAVDEWNLTNDSTLLAAGILGAITSARADLIVIDDPVAGREEANSETIRKKTLEAYNDDLLTRLKPGGSVVLIQTRWHPDDLAGSILPEDWSGESGIVRCRDGKDWEVLCLPAKAERLDDPLGREVGEYLWPEWFDREHWAQFEANPVTWASLFQQRPRPDEGNQFEAEWIEWYDPEDLPKSMNFYAASDYAVTKLTLSSKPDFTEHGVGGVCEDGDLWLVDWWSKQDTADVTVHAGLALHKAWKTVFWFGEKGVIENAIAPLRSRISKEIRSFPNIELLPTVGDKVARVASFRGLMRAGKVHLPRGKQWAIDLRDQLVAFTGLDGCRDDKVDVCGLIGRGLDLMVNARKPKKETKPKIVPFTRAHFDAMDRRDRESQEKAKEYYL